MHPILLRQVRRLFEGSAYLVRKSPNCYNYQRKYNIVWIFEDTWENNVPICFTYTT